MQVCPQTKCMAELGFGGECFLFPEPVEASALILPCKLICREPANLSQVNE